VPYSVTGVLCSQTNSLTATWYQNFFTQILLYTKQSYQLCVFIFVHEKKCTNLNSAYGHRVVPRDFLNHALNCQWISQQQYTERRLHVCNIDINVWIVDLRNIFNFANFTLWTHCFLRCKWIPTCTMCSINSLICFRVTFPLLVKRKNPCFFNYILQSTQ
jgi:hypothetical protein